MENKQNPIVNTVIDTVRTMLNDIFNNVIEDTGYRRDWETDSVIPRTNIVRFDTEAFRLEINTEYQASMLFELMKPVPEDRVGDSRKMWDHNMDFSKEFHSKRQYLYRSINNPIGRIRNKCYLNEQNYIFDQKYWKYLRIELTRLHDEYIAEQEQIEAKRKQKLEETQQLNRMKVCCMLDDSIIDIPGFKKSEQRAHLDGYSVHYRSEQTDGSLFENTSIDVSYYLNENNEVVRTTVEIDPSATELTDESEMITISRRGVKKMIQNYIASIGETFRQEYDYGYRFEAIFDYRITIGKINEWMQAINGKLLKLKEVYQTITMENENGKQTV